MRHPSSEMAYASAIRSPWTVTRRHFPIARSHADNVVRLEGLGGRSFVCPSFIPECVSASSSAYNA